MKRLFFLAALLILTTQVFADSPSWPQWRGPRGDGVSLETGWNAKALEGGAKILWTAMIGQGYSNVAITCGRLYAMGSRDNQVVFTCLDAASGSVIWQKVFEELSGDSQSTPAVDGDRVYGLTKFGYLLCLNTADGTVIWQKKLPPTPYLALWATSPIVDGNVVLINAHHAGMALDKTTGNVVWDSGTSAKNSPVADAEFDQGHDTYSSPVVLDLQGKRAALFMGPTALSAVETSTGKVLWSKPHLGDEGTTDPIVSGNFVFMPEHLPTLFEVGKSDPRIIWKGSGFMCCVSTPVLVKGYLYVLWWDTSIPGRSTWGPVKARQWPFLCVDWRTGKVVWTKPGPFLQFTASDGKLIMLDLNGTLSVVEASPQEFRPISSADVLAGADRPRLFPTPPVLCDGRVYCRNYAGDLVCIDVSR
jgi:outer membrane protein assembly factor BamB